MLPEEDGTFIVRTASSNPLALASTLRQQVSRTRSGFHVSNVETQLEINQSQTIRERLLATLAFFFGAVALLLAGVGLYGVLELFGAAAGAGNRDSHGAGRADRACCTTGHCGNFVRSHRWVCLRGWCLGWR